MITTSDKAMITLSKALGRPLLVGDVLQKIRPCQSGLHFLLGHSIGKGPVEQREILLTQQMISAYSHFAYEEGILSWDEKQLLYADDLELPLSVKPWHYNNDHLVQEMLREDAQHRRVTKLFQS